MREGRCAIGSIDDESRTWSAGANRMGSSTIMPASRVTGAATNASLLARIWRPERRISWGHGGAAAAGDVGNSFGTLQEHGKGFEDRSVGCGQWNHE